jgi:hypothetical protein
VLHRLAHERTMMDPRLLSLQPRTSTASHHAPGAGLLARCEVKKGREVKTKALPSQGLQNVLHRMAHGRTMLDPQLLLLRLAGMDDLLTTRVAIRQPAQAG